MPAPTHDFLLEHGTMVVDHINHREFVYNGRQYSFGWNSKLDPHTGEVYGWMFLREVVDTSDRK